MKAVLAALLCAVAVVASAETLECVPVPDELFQSGNSLFPKGLPSGSRLAGAGRTLGVLAPRLPEGHRLILVRGGKVVGESWLPSPKERPFPRPPAFSLASEGEIAALSLRDFFAVYAGGTLTAVIDGEQAHAAQVGATRGTLFWAPFPTEDHSMRFFGPRDFSLLEAEEWPALLVRSELDGSDRKVLLRIERDRLEKGDREPLYHTLALAMRSDRKLWLVGRFSGEVMLAEGNGKVVTRFSLPDTLKRPEDDEEVRREQEEEMRREFERDAARSGDATKRPPRKVEVVFSNKSHLFHEAYARGKDLVLTMATVDPPQGSLLLLRDGEEAARCFVFSQRLRGADDPVLQMAVTDDAVWFRRPFGSISWASLEGLLEERQADR